MAIVGFTATVVVIKQKIAKIRMRARNKIESGTITARHDGGRELSLSLVRHLVKLHGGSVTAESDGEGKRAIFTVRLPVEP